MIWEGASTNAQAFLLSQVLDTKISPLENLLVVQATHFNSRDTHLYVHILFSFDYRLQSEGDNVLGSVRPSVHPSILGAWLC